MALDGISRNDYEKLMRYTLPNDYFENVSRNRGRGQNNAWGPDYCFPDGLSSTKYCAFPQKSRWGALGRSLRPPAAGLWLACR